MQTRHNDKNYPTTLSIMLENFYIDTYLDLGSLGASSGTKFLSKFTRFYYQISLFQCLYIVRVKHTFELCEPKSCASTRKTQSAVLNWKLKSENYLPPQNMFDGSAIGNELCRRLIAVYFLILVKLKQ